MQNVFRQMKDFGEEIDLSGDLAWVGIAEPDQGWDLWRRCEWADVGGTPVARKIALPDLLEGARNLGPGPEELSPEELARARDTARDALQGGRLFVALALAVIATGVAKMTCCQPEAVSSTKVALASKGTVWLDRLTV